MEHKTLERIHVILMAPEKAFDRLVVMACGVLMFTAVLIKLVLSPVLALPRTFGWWVRTRDPRYIDGFKKQIDGRMAAFLWHKYLIEISSMCTIS